MRTLALVRHGETVGNSRVRYYGRTDIELCDLGRRQMRAAAHWLRRHLGVARFTPVIASPLRRAAEGAAIIAGDSSPIVESKEFVEVDFGLFEGLTAEEIESRFPAEFECWSRDRFDPAFAYPAGESRAEFGRRVERGVQLMLEVIDASPADHPALVVAHRGVIRIIASRLAGLEPVIELGSIHILRRDRDGSLWHADVIDAVAHLAELE